MPGVLRMLSLHFLLPLVGTFGNGIARILSGLGRDSSNHQVVSYSLRVVAKAGIFLFCDCSVGQWIYCSLFIEIYAE